MKAFLFPGQGSQSVGMGQFLHNEFKIARETFEEASDALSIDMKKLCFNETLEALSLTENTQPALLTVSTATARVLNQVIGVKPQITAGHSIGEYASLVLSSVINFKDAVKAVRLRGQAMQSAVPVGQGGMSATLGLNEEQVQFLCDWAMQETQQKPLSPANYNCDGQIVISGNLNILNWLKTNFKPEILPGAPKKAKIIPLQVSAPFHCEMMKPAELKMKEFLATLNFRNATIPIIQNVNAKTQIEADVIRTNIVAQVSAPVMWTQSMNLLKKENVQNVFEVGNGSVLKGLLKKIDAEFFKVYSTSTLEDLKSIESQFKS